MERQAIADALRGAGVAEETAARLSEYGALVLEANRRTNLTGARTPKALAEHIIDSLTLVPYAQGPLVDVGSGAGFPAIPVAIATGIAVTLIEANGKKARFLSGALETLGVQATVICDRAETAAHRPDLREQFAAGTARALARATTTAELVVPFLGIGGIAALQRGRMANEERNSLSDAALVLGAELAEIVDVDASRQIAVLVKKRPTPARFPRRSGVPAKRPLCSD